MVNIFIANLDWSITSEDLNTTFSSFGTVHYAHVVYEKESRKSRGYGYVEMESADAAIAAIEALNGMEINGRGIDVKIASPKSNRPKKEDKPAEAVKKPFNKPGGARPYNNAGGNKPYRPNDGEKRYSNNNQGGERRFNNTGERSYTPRENNDRPYTPRDGNSSDRPYTPRPASNDRPYTPRESSSEDRVYPSRDSQERAPREPEVERFTSKPIEDTNSSESTEAKRVLRPRRNKQ